MATHTTSHARFRPNRAGLLRRTRRRVTASMIAVGLLASALAITVSSPPASAAALPTPEVAMDAPAGSSPRSTGTGNSLVAALPDGTAAATLSSVAKPTVAIRSIEGAWTSLDVNHSAGFVYGADMAPVGQDKAAVVWMQNQNLPGGQEIWNLWATVVTPAAGTFTTPTIIAAGVSNPNFVQLASGADRNATVVFSRARTGGGFELASSVLSPNVGTWSVPFATTLTSPTDFVNFDIGSLGGGRYLAMAHARTFENVTARPEKVQTAVLEPGATTWNAPSTVFDQTTTHSPQDFEFASWGGGGFPGAVLLTKTLFGSDISIQAWSYNPGAGTWSEPTVFGHLVNYAKVASNPLDAGATVIVIDSFPEVVNGNSFDSVGSYSFDGRTWGARQAVDPEPAHRLRPTLAIADDGSALATWGSGTHDDYATRSGPNGAWLGGTSGPAAVATAIWRANGFIIMTIESSKALALVFGQAVLAKPKPALTLTGDPDPDLPRRVHADASASTHESSARHIVEYQWEWDGQSRTTTSPTTTLDFRQGGQRQVTLTVTDDVGETADITKEILLEYGEALKVDVSLDPATADQPEGPDGPEPVDTTATLSFTNLTDVDMTSVTLMSLLVQRTKAGQLVAVTQTGGADPGDDGLAIGSLDPGQTKTVEATFRATDDAEVDIAAQAKATLADGREEVGLGKKRWSVKPKYLLSLTSKVVNPAGNALIPAGETVRISGRIKNMSTTATLEVGPMYPTLAGNGGAMSLSWDDIGTDPKALTPAQGVTLEPSESKTFTVRILTGYSDPMDASGNPKPSGGTKLTASFTPWAKVTFEDDTERAMKPEELKTTDDDLSHRIAIDDSIAIPQINGAAFSAAILLGGVEGIWSAACGMVSGLYDLAKAPYTVIMATSSIQAQVWASFTEEEKQEFATDAAAMSASVLMRNAELAKDGFDKLLDQVRTSTYNSMTEMENNWQLGDYTSTVELWSSYGANAISQVVVPTALGKIARFPKVAVALERTQLALQTKMAPLVARAGRLTKVEELVPVLEALESGTQLKPEELAQLFGITLDEYAEIKKIADDLGIMITVRSRNETSIEWIKRARALLKPETLKIKTVSSLDVKLGYPKLEGSLVFRKPEVLTLFEKGGRDMGVILDEYARSKGFVTGTADWAEAVQRLMDRVTEWQKWGKKYEQWSKRGWIETSFDFDGNAAGDFLHPKASAQGVGKLALGKFEGFRLRPTGARADEYIVEMLRGKTNEWVPVTGDIDPIAYTHLDGTPLSLNEHIAVLERMRTNPLLQGKHGESATLAKGGVDFVESQFKPNEPGLQIAPGDNLPRVVRLNRQSGKTYWNDSFDYHLQWDGGFEYAGSYVPRTATPLPPRIVPAATPLPKGVVSPLPAALTPGPNVGRCRITYGTPLGNVNAVVDANGKISTLAGKPTKNTTEPSPLHGACFSGGPVIELTVAPMTGVLDDVAAGAQEIDVPDQDMAWYGQTGTDILVGDEVTIGAGGPTAETHTVAAFGSIIIDSPLRYDHEAGEAIVVTKAVPRPVPPGETTTTTGPPLSVTTAPPATSSPVSFQPQALAATTRRPSGTQPVAAATGDLPRTGSDSVPATALALGLIAAGTALLRVNRSTRRRHRPT